MEIVASNEFYSIKVDKNKNRVYFSIIGSWGKRSDVEDYLLDWNKALKFLKPGFNILSDLTKMGPTLLTDLHLEAQELLIKEGLEKVAEVYEGQVFAKMQIDKVSETSGMKKTVFDDMKKAEDWLDAD